MSTKRRIQEALVNLCIQYTSRFSVTRWVICCTIHYYPPFRLYLPQSLLLSLKYILDVILQVLINFNLILLSMLALPHASWHWSLLSGKASCWRNYCLAHQIIRVIIAADTLRGWIDPHLNVLIGLILSWRSNCPKEFIWEIIASLIGSIHFLRLVWSCAASLKVVLGDDF